LVLAVLGWCAWVGSARLCREDDTPTPVRAYRGTTSLAVRPVLRPRVRDLGQRPLVTRLWRAGPARF